jgi:hypothetical protein
MNSYYFKPRFRIRNLLHLNYFIVCIYSVCFVFKELIVSSFSSMSLKDFSLHFFKNVTLAKTRRRKEIDSKLCAFASWREKTKLNLMTLSFSWRDKNCRFLLILAKNSQTFWLKPIYNNHYIYS